MSYKKISKKVSEETNAKKKPAEEITHEPTHITKNGDRHYNPHTCVCKGVNPYSPNYGYETEQKENAKQPKPKDTTESSKPGKWSHEVMGKCNPYSAYYGYEG